MGFGESFYNYSENYCLLSSFNFESIDSWIQLIKGGTLLYADVCKGYTVYRGVCQKF